MKCQKYKIIFISLATILSASCDRNANCEKIDDVLGAANCYAHESDIDLSAFEPGQIKSMMNGEITSANLKNDEYSKDALSPLQGRRYFEVCYDHAQTGAADRICIYIDKKDRKLILINFGV